MSAKIMGQVFDLALPRAQKQVLLALADHADHDGNNAYPGVELLVYKTGYSERQVQRSLAALSSDGLIVADENAKGGRGKIPHYSIHLEKGDKMAPIKRVTNGHPKQTEKGDMVPPIDGLKGDIDDTKRVPSCPLKGDIDDTIPFSLYEPSLEPSLEPLSDAAEPRPKRAGARVVDYTTEFLAFWEPYPQCGRLRGSKTLAFSEWRRMTAPTQTLVLSALHKALLHPGFVAKYAPAPERWLREGKWESYLEFAPPPPSGAVPGSPASEGGGLAAKSAACEARFAALRQTRSIP